MVRDQLIQVLLLRLPARRRRVVEESGREQETCDCHVGVSGVLDLVEDDTDELTHGEVSLIIAHTVDVLRAELVQLCDEYPLALAVPDSLAEGPLLVLIKLGAVPAGKDQTLDVRFKGPVELSLPWNHRTYVRLSSSRILLSLPAITSHDPIVIPEANHLL